MLAVFNVVEGGQTIPMIARLFRKSYNSIKNWIARFKKLGTAGLHEEPRSGRPTKLVNHKITEFFAGVKNGIFPKQLVRQIKKDTGAKYTESGIRDCCTVITLLQRCPDSTHKNKATCEEIEEWQKSLKRRISCVKQGGFELYMQEEIMLLQDHVPKRGPWSPGGQKVFQIYFGDHQTDDLRCNIGFAPVLSTGKKIDGSTFLKFVKKLLGRSYKTAVVMDAASQHRTKDLKEFVKENSRRLRIMYIPTGCPELGAIEECWHQLKIQPFMYEHHEHVSGRARAAMKYLRTAAFSQNIEQCLFGKLIAKTF